ncbi:ferrous iron transport protein B [Dysosmobacter sp.]|uniref:ferrous iron transport protein B n=1 Tax=Dysosmobacter sp. TaxID=2591382 RepID=UPI002672F046|nr:ferrous iron transport protein B [Dysosmobacter sp.]MCI7215798.1 ferrous iron transport protein B [Dysosmobacter sp.]MCI7281592.1 ferrous iron transport protein B [Dysosmobacter sp.]MDY3653389.1 ferrous iron transport protein B [Dysosmobacter sp.]
MEKQIKIALAGNPNCGKTTLFNALTGSNQFVGNWPGVTVEKKEGKLKKHDNVVIMDLPGIYSLSPYTLEEVVARNYLVGERPDAILNIIDGTNLERNLYLTTQLTELGIPVVIAINMMDVVRKNGDQINVAELSRELGVRIIEISALKGDGVMEAAEAAVKAAEGTKTVPMHTFSGPVEHAIAHIEEAAVHNLPEEQQRWYAIKIFERDDKVLEKLSIPADVMSHIETDIQAAEKELDDDAESIITNERYVYIAELIKSCYKKHNQGQLSASDKIDRIVTNRWLGLPIFAVVMYLVYYIAMVTVGSAATDWANDGLFGDGWHLFGIGSSEYSEVADNYTAASEAISAYYDLDTEADDFDPDTTLADMKAVQPASASTTIEVEDEETLAMNDMTVYYDAIPADADEETTVGMSYLDAVTYFEENGFDEPDPADYGVWVPGVPVLIGNALEAAGTAEWLNGLILDGIVAGVGAVLGFVPQMLVLFLMLAFLEACGYMARIAFVLDRIFRKFGLSGKSFIPMLIGTGCGIPGIMASRTIENERDRRMTIMTTTFIPCGAKVPFIAMVAGAIFGGAAWVATSAYFVGMAAIIISGIMLKKTKMFAGDPAPFVMELPAYHWPTVGNVLRSMWERGWSFIKKAGTIILLSTIAVWFTTYFGWAEDGFRMLSEEEIDCSILAHIGSLIAWIFAPLGWGNWKAAVASITGLVAKENIVGTLGILYGGGDETVYQALGTVFTQISGYSFLVFNLLCAPCFAAIGAIKREMNNAKWTWFAIGYQCGFAYLCALMVNQFGKAFTGDLSVLGLVAALAALAFILYMLVRPYKEATKLSAKV